MTSRHSPGCRRPSSIGPYATRSSRVTSASAGEEAADLAILPFRQLDDQVRFAPRALADADGAGAQPVHTALEGPARLARHLAACGDDIAPHEGVLWIREVLGKLRIRRQEQQAGGRDIQAAHGDQTLAALPRTSKTVRRPCGSRRVVTTPRGL